MSHLAPLVLLAAGLGSRFGGIKALAPVGPNGEPLLLVSLRQAANAGFDRAVIVVSPTTEQVVRDALALSRVPCTFASQTTPTGRIKPLGTVDAGLSAYDSLPVPPASIVVANGDDLYGSAALMTALAWTRRADSADYLDRDDRTERSDAIAALPRFAATLPSTGQRHGRDLGTAAAVLYRLGTTVPRGDHGGVSRAIVERDAEDQLVSITECRDVCWVDGVLRSPNATDVLPPDAAVSMNLWCLSRRAVEVMRGERDRLAESTDPNGEVGLPDTINRLVRGGTLRVDTTVTNSTWHGITWPDDVAAVRAALLAESTSR